MRIFIVDFDFVVMMLSADRDNELQSQMNWLIVTKCSDFRRPFLHFQRVAIAPLSVCLYDKHLINMNSALFLIRWTCTFSSLSEWAIICYENRRIIRQTFGIVEVKTGLVRSTNRLNVSEYFESILFVNLWRWEDVTMNIIINHDPWWKPAAAKYETNTSWYEIEGIHSFGGFSITLTPLYLFRAIIARLKRSIEHQLCHRSTH